MLLLALKLRRRGIRYPLITIQEARRAGLELAILCAVLEQEGGRNVFGHDPTIFVGAGKVTKRKYLAYKRQRYRGGFQGVGPMQLTWYAYQDQADRYGGCWKPRYNIRVGAEILAKGLKTQFPWRVFKNYNGSEQYAWEVLGKLRRWRTVLE